MPPGVVPARTEDMGQEPWGLAFPDGSQAIPGLDARPFEHVLTHTKKTVRNQGPEGLDSTASPNTAKHRFSHRNKLLHTPNKPLHKRRTHRPTATVVNVREKPLGTPPRSGPANRLKISGWVARAKKTYERGGGAPGMTTRNKVRYERNNKGHRDSNGARSFSR